MTTRTLIVIEIRHPGGDVAQRVIDAILAEGWLENRRHLPVAVYTHPVSETPTTPAGTALIYAGTLTHDRNGSRWEALRATLAHAAGCAASQVVINEVLPADASGPAMHSALVNGCWVFGRGSQGVG